MTLNASWDAFFTDCNKEFIMGNQYHACSSIKVWPLITHLNYELVKKLSTELFGKEIPRIFSLLFPRKENVKFKHVFMCVQAGANIKGPSETVTSVALQFFFAGCAE